MNMIERVKYIRSKLPGYVVWEEMKPSEHNTSLLRLFDIDNALYSNDAMYALFVKCYWEVAGTYVEDDFGYGKLYETFDLMERYARLQAFS